MNFTNNELWQNWTGGIVQGVLEEAGIYNSTGFITLARQIYNIWGQGKPMKKINLGAVDIESGSYRVINETFSVDEIIHGLAGSCSIPVYFPSVKFNDA